MNAPVSLPIAPAHLWPSIASMFGVWDTATIADELRISEAAVANALHRMREEART